MAASGPASPTRLAATLAQRFAQRPAEAALTSPTAKRRRLAAPTSSAAEGTSTASVVTDVPTEGDARATAASTDLIKNRELESHERVVIITKSIKRQRTSSPGSNSSTAGRLLSTSASAKPIAAACNPLTEDDLLKLERETLHSSWLNVLEKELHTDYFLKLKRFLWTEGVKSGEVASESIFPPAREIYSWSHLTPLPDVRVVILGQDPYHNDGQAHGLAFSVRSNVKVPPSLKNIYKEVKNDYPAFKIPTHGYLACWAQQGVLLLNTSLTVRAHQANSHSKRGWESFTDAILRAIDQRQGPGVVFLAWGTPALNRIKGLMATSSTPQKHLVLSSVHPSPLSANRGFFGNGHFKRANDWLIEQYGGGESAAIDWTTLAPNTR